MPSHNFALLLCRSLPTLLFLIVMGHFLNPTFCLAQDTAPEQFGKRVLVKGLKDPWSIAYGPDKHLWVTESKSYNLLRIDPDSGEMDTIANLSNERRFPRYDRLPEELQEGKPWPQGGLMGMALHPDLLNGKPIFIWQWCMSLKEAGAKGMADLPKIKAIILRPKLSVIPTCPAAIP